ncbi:MAG: hypothetical protein HC828_17060, partial [Blastochloris sp.]|nr:hypothetical protein [Blastochloris sp.]
LADEGVLSCPRRSISSAGTQRRQRRWTIAAKLPSANAPISRWCSTGRANIPRVRAAMRGGHFIFQDVAIGRLVNSTLDQQQRDELFA